MLKEVSRSHLFKAGDAGRVHFCHDIEAGDDGLKQ